MKTLIALTSTALLGLACGAPAPEMEAVVDGSESIRADPADTMELYVVEPESGFVTIPSDDYTVGLPGNTTVVWPFRPGAGIVQVSTIGFDFPSEWHKWEMAIATEPGSFDAVGSGCSLAGATNRPNELFRLTIVASNDYDWPGNCVIGGVYDELYVNIRPLMSGSKSCDDMLCRFEFVDTASRY